MEVIQMATDGIHQKVYEMISKVCTKESKILIAASGKGAFEKKLVEELGISPENITSIDIDENYGYEPCKANFRTGNLNFPLDFLSDGQFDIVISIETIEHVSNQQNMIGEFYRVLTKKGYLLISSPNCESLASRLYFMVKGIFPSFEKVHFDLSGHIVPFFSWTLTYFTTGKSIKVVDYDSNSFHLWIIPYFLKVKVPSKSRLFAETNIWLLEKTEN